MNKKHKAEINAFYDMYKKEKGEKMYYKFKCTACGKEEERNILISDYDREKEKQVCSCGEKMERVIEWEGIAEGSGQGWCGARGGNII